MKKECKWCNENKNIREFYDNNYSMCKECKKMESRNNKFTKNEVLNMLDGLHNMFENRMNSMEVLFRDILKRNENKIDKHNINVFLNFIIEILILKNNTDNDKKEILDIVIEFMNYNNIQINKKTNDIYTLFKDKNYNDEKIMETIESINIRNKKIDDSINTIINYNKKSITFDNEYEKRLEEIMMD